MPQPRKYPAPVPLLLPAVALAAGIVAEWWCAGRGLVVTPRWALLALALLVAAALTLRRHKTAQSTAIVLCFWLLGATVAALQRASSAAGTTLPQQGHSAPVEAVVTGEPAERPRTMALDLLLPTVAGRPTLRCYVWKDDRSRQLQLGDGLRATVTNGRFIRRSQWQPCPEALQRLSGTERLRLRALHWRHGLLQRLRALGANEQQYGVLAAMTLGDKSALGTDVRQTFSQTGAAHVLALSGLHLGIISLLLMRLIPGGRRWWAGQALLVLALWAFALLTGLSASVVRAATMLSLYAVFSAGARRRSPFNVLCFTAMVMLLVSPRVLFDAGFQLSFSAVAAILLFCPLLDGLVSQPWLAGHRPARWLWSLVSVSLAAQLGTAPLVAYYFHQLPTYFLLTNLIVVPAATLILYGTLTTLLLPAAGAALLWVVRALNGTLQWLAALPLSSIDGLHPSRLQTVMVYVLIAVVWRLLATYNPASAEYRSGWPQS